MKILRQYIPKRLSELIALVSLSATVFLFIHTRSLTHRLEEVQRPFESPIEDAAYEFANEENYGAKSHLSRELNTAPEVHYGKLDANELNNTRKATKDVLFFNRVPKVGSQFTMELMKSLSIKNDFHYHKDRTQKVETIKLTYNEEKWLANLINYFDPPSVYVKHVCYVNFTQ